MSVAASNSFLQVSGIRSCVKHSLIVIRFHPQIVGNAYKPGYGRSDAPYVGYERKHLVAYLYAISYIVCRVERNLKTCNLQIIQLNSLSFTDKPLHGVCQLLCHAGTPSHALMYLMCGIYRDIVLPCKMSYSLYVVGMIVCHENSPHVTQVQTVILENLFHGTYSQSPIDENGSIAVAQVVAVSAASACNTA